MSAQWMTPRECAEESGRHFRCVNDALRRGLLVGVQPRAGCRWRVKRSDFDAWMESGAPVDAPARARLRRAS